jgi:hypothetical protein
MSTKHSTCIFDIFRGVEAIISTTQWTRMPASIQTVRRYTRIDQNANPSTSRGGLDFRNRDFHDRPPLLALRTLGQPSAIHCSITARDQRIKDPSLTGFGIRPESAQRRTDRLQQPISIATSSTDIIARWWPSRTAFVAF